jgi:hypothetical protein
LRPGKGFEFVDLKNQNIGIKNCFFAEKRLQADQMDLDTVELLQM